LLYYCIKVYYIILYYFVWSCLNAYLDEEEEAAAAAAVSSPSTMILYDLLYRPTTTTRGNPRRRQPRLWRWGRARGNRTTDRRTDHAHIKHNNNNNNNIPNRRFGRAAETYVVHPSRTARPNIIIHVGDLQLQCNKCRLIGWIGRPCACPCTHGAMSCMHYNVVRAEKKTRPKP